jgi:hypothetical protein
LVNFGMRTNMLPTGDRQVNEKPFRIAINLRESDCIRPHMLRHACGYALANKGHDTRVIQGWLGHRSITSTAVYTALAPNRGAAPLAIGRRIVRFGCVKTTKKNSGKSAPGDHASELPIRYMSSRLLWSAL